MNLSIFVKDDSSSNNIVINNYIRAKEKYITHIHTNTHSFIEIYGIYPN